MQELVHNAGNAKIWVLLSGPVTGNISKVVRTLNNLEAEMEDSRNTWLKDVESWNMLKRDLKGGLFHNAWLPFSAHAGPLFPRFGQPWISQMRSKRRTDGNVVPCWENVREEVHRYVPLEARQFEVLCFDGAPEIAKLVSKYIYTYTYTYTVFNILWVN